MKISYSRDNHNNKVNKMSFSKISKKAIAGGLSFIMTLGTGMIDVSAQIESDLEKADFSNIGKIESLENRKMFENGYNFYKTGNKIYVDIDDWDIEKNFYFNKGIQTAVEAGEEMVAGEEAPQYSMKTNYSEMSTSELMVNAKRVYEEGIEFAETGILNSIGDPALDELRKRGIEFDPVQGGINYFEAQGNERHAPVVGNVETLNEKEIEKWKQYGEAFFETGEFPSEEEWDYDTKNTNNLAGRIACFNNGIERAIEEGKQIVSGNSEINYENISELSNTELLKILATENWYELGIEYQKTGNLPVQIVNGSLVDEILSARGITLSASDVFQAGCNNERLKHIENKEYTENIVKKEDVEEIISTISLNEIIKTNNDLEKVINSNTIDKER